ncbi:MAG: RIP metalloprotease RseP [unclassified Hahellaceae]|nr:RIP metalloprotease RseP [Hahellaceae bacterium]|tara:strand:+ start:20620 stop:21975 length:1356 start_codon:yes stop_codon:yes gene_type:complete
MSFIQNALALIVTLGILVTIHEFGHFWVARRCGVKVLRFSVGFGRPIWKRIGATGTEYVIAAIPLGGYVKMLDEREGPVEDAELEQSFNQKPVQQRIAIAAAGPLANFLFAILVYWVVFVVGVQAVKPLTGQIEKDSVADRRGLTPELTIVAVDGKPTNDWSEVNLQLIDRLGDSGSIRLATQDTDGASREFSLPVSDWLSGQRDPNPLQALGISPWRPAITPRIETVVEGGRAEQAGLAPGDLITTVNGIQVETWDALVQFIQASPEKSLDIEYRQLESGDTRQTMLVPESRIVNGDSQGFIGASVDVPEWPADKLIEISYGPVDALWEAVEKTADMAAMILTSLKKLVVGAISPDNLGGPITIAKAAGQSAGFGSEAFISFLAHLSIMLGVLNLLPVPVLDGGHLLYYFAELVRGKPLPESVQMAGIRLGMMLLGGVMLLAIFNDFARL